MADVKFEISGLGELLGKLESINYDLKRKGGRASLRKAAKVAADAAKAGASRIDDPATAENIARNIAIKWDNKTFKSTGDLKFRVGVLGGARSTSRGAIKSARRRAARGIASLESLGEIQGRGKGNPGGDTWYWRFVEFGTERTRAKPFMRPALERNIGKCTDTFVTEYGKYIDRAIKRARKKAVK